MAPPATTAVADAVAVSVWFLDQGAYAAGREPHLVAVGRKVPARSPLDGAVAAVLAGPSRAEHDRGLRLVSSGATGTSRVGVQRATALVRLLGGCTSGGSTVTVADLLVATLRQFEGIRWVKVYGPDGSTENPAAPGDSLPECLEP